MNMNTDLDMEIAQKQVKQGRRANQNLSSTSSTSFDLDVSESTTEPNIKAPARLKKPGGWADETIKSAKNKSTTNLIEQQRFQEQKIDLSDSIPIIPDIEEIPDDILEADVAQVPMHTVKSVSTYKELDNELLYNNTVRQFGDINLSFLTRYMYANKDIKETDETWTKESLFNELIINSNSSSDK